MFLPHLTEHEKYNNLRRPGIEPGSRRWQRRILPLNHRRLHDPIIYQQYLLINQYLTMMHFSKIDHLWS